MSEPVVKVHELLVGGMSGNGEFAGWIDDEGACRDDVGREVGDCEDDADGAALLVRHWVAKQRARDKRAALAVTS